MKAIYRKELGQLFHSMTGYICLAVFALLGGCFFVIYNLLQGNGDIRNYFSPMMSTVIFIIPVLTMRSYAEERRGRTDQLLMSAPVSMLSIALGKFFAIMTLFAVGLSFSLIYVIVLALLGQFDFLVVLGNIVGMLVSGVCLCSDRHAHLRPDREPDNRLHRQLCRSPRPVADRFSSELYHERGRKGSRRLAVRIKALRGIFHGDI